MSSREIEPMDSFRGVVVGGGVVGTAMARALAVSFGIGDVALLEKESSLGQHSSTRNSGVLHSGFHLSPGSLKANLCREGARRLTAYCASRSLPFRRVGKTVVAVDERERPILHEMLKRARLHGIAGARLLDRRELLDIEPMAGGVAGFHSPEDALIDGPSLVRSFAKEAEEAGVQILLGVRLQELRLMRSHLILQTTRGEIRCRWLINCAGLYADQVAWMCGLAKGLRIIPFRGEYFRVGHDQIDLARGLIYPAPHPRFPFLGVHFTPTVHGELLLGPNAVLALGRESYSMRDMSLSEALKTLSSHHLLRMFADSSLVAQAFWQARTCLSREAFLKSARRLVPTLRPAGIEPARAGNRAQVVNRQGRLVEDFRFALGRRSFHVLNAVSPGLTCSLAFADFALRRLMECSSILQS